MENTHCNFCLKTDSMSSCSTNCYLSVQQDCTAKCSRVNQENMNINKRGKEPVSNSNQKNKITKGCEGFNTSNLQGNKSKQKDNQKRSVKVNVSKIPVLKNPPNFPTPDAAYAAKQEAKNYPFASYNCVGDAGFNPAELQNTPINDVFYMSVKNILPKIHKFGSEVEERKDKRTPKSRKIFTVNENLEVSKATSLDSFKASEGSERLTNVPQLHPPINLNTAYDQQVMCRRSQSDFEYEKLLGNIRKIKTKDKLTTLFSMVSEIERNSLIGQTFITELQILFSTENDQEDYKVVDMDEIEILLPNYSVDIIISKVYKVNKHDSANIISHYVKEIKDLISTKNIRIYPDMKTFLANIFCSHQDAEVRFLAVNKAAYKFWSENKQANTSGLDRKSVQSLKELLVQLIHTKEVIFQSELSLKGVIERYVETEREEDKEEMVRAISVHQEMIETALRSTDDFATSVLGQKVEELIKNLKESQCAVSSLLVKNDQLKVQNVELMDVYKKKGKGVSCFEDSREVENFDKNERLRERIVLVQKRLHTIEEKLSKSEEQNANLQDKLLVLRAQLDSERRSAQSLQANLQLEIACIKRINTGRESALRQASSAGDGLLKDISRIEQSLMKAGKKVQLLPQEMLAPSRSSFIDFVTTCRSCIKVLSQELISTLDTVAGLKNRLDIVTVDNTYANQDIKDLTAEIAQLKEELLKLKHINIQNKLGSKNQNTCVQTSSQTDLILPSPRGNNTQETQELMNLKDTNKDLKRKLSLVEQRCEELTQEMGAVYKEKESLMFDLHESDTKLQSSEKIFKELQKENKMLIESNENLTEKLVAAMNLLSYSKSVVENLNRRKNGESCSEDKQRD
ncbi:hypothetical protein LSTR_LSTR012334 [Laodelphax striatellus]|uniref:Uncharacterized protein n=1 Tax=Laodelphax striatellus TaxID=195883 RepID=A0A482X8C9_LAOST|nr:hypothetical protein LSTR_LSTR012334 [Laodelphax striatellus]